METPGNPNKTILVIDDEAFDRDTMRHTLQSEGYTVLKADTYQRAYGVFQSKADVIDLLIADVSLPDGNGCELALAIRDRRPEIRVLFT